MSSAKIVGSSSKNCRILTNVWNILRIAINIFNIVRSAAAQSFDEILDNSSSKIFLGVLDESISFIFTTYVCSPSPSSISFESTISKLYLLKIFLQSITSGPNSACNKAICSSTSDGSP